MVFVFDESSCSEPVKEEVKDMLAALYQQIEGSGAAIKIGAVQFRGEDHGVFADGAYGHHQGRHGAVHV